MRRYSRVFPRTEQTAETAADIGNGDLALLILRHGHRRRLLGHRRWRKVSRIVLVPRGEIGRARAAKNTVQTQKTNQTWLGRLQYGAPFRLPG